MDESREPMDRQVSLGVMTIATNSYVEHWKRQAASIDGLDHSGLDVTLHVFTDDLASIREFSKDLVVKVVAYSIPSYRWPEATLYRYRIFHDHRDSLTQDILMYLDADMLVNQGFSKVGLTKPLRSGVCLVKHPGYYRPTALSLLKLYMKDPRLAVADLLLYVSHGGIGSWEHNTRSLAYVPRSLRKRYFCGGIWWGLRHDILALCTLLASRVSQDETQGQQAVWHDESHLNWWASQNSSGIETPRYCYAAGYPQLEDLELFVTAVDKKNQP
jgi:hypothetical protein